MHITIQAFKQVEFWPVTNIVVDICKLTHIHISQ